MTTETPHERSKRLRAERNRRYRERVRERAEEGETLLPSVQALADRENPRRARPYDRSSGGRILGVLTLPGPYAISQGAQPEVVYNPRGRATLPSANYTAWLDERDAASGRGRYDRYGRYIPPPKKTQPEPDEPCAIRTPVGQYTYDLTIEDIDRLAPVVAEEVGAHVNAVREAMANCQPGQTVVLST